MKKSNRFSKFLFKRVRWISSKRWGFLILTAFATLVTLKWIFCVFDPTDNHNSDNYSSLFEILTATIIALLGVAITSYIFLHTELQGRKKDNQYMRNSIECLLGKNRVDLICNCLIGLIAFVSLILSYELHSLHVWVLAYLTLVSYLSIAWLIWFNISIVNHNQALLNESIKLLATKREKAESTLSLQRNLKYESYELGSIEISYFFKAVTDVQKFIEKIINNHSQQVRGTPVANQLASILKSKNENNENSESLAKQYEWLFDYRDLLLVTIELTQNDEIQELMLPIELPRNIEMQLTQLYLKDELISDSSFSAKKLESASFEGTSFSGSFLYQIEFDECDLSNSSFENCRLIDVKIVNSDEKLKGINFYRAIISVEFSGSPKFHFCNFTETDFSKQESLSNIDFLSSTFKRANFIGEKGAIVFNKVLMKSTICVEAKFSVAFLTKVDFSSANLTKADFSSAKLEECGFERANLENAIFYYAGIEKTSFKHSRLDNANFIDASINKCNFQNSYGNNVSFRNCIIQDDENLNVQKTIFRYAVLSNSDFSTAVISDSDFSYVTFTNSLFIRCSAKNVSYDNAVFIGVQFLDELPNISRKYEGCSFTSAIFNNAIITGVRFCKCDFALSSFDGAILKNVEFCGCSGLSPSQFKKASLDSFTIECLNKAGCDVNTAFITKKKTLLKSNENEFSTFDALLSARHSTRLFQPEFVISDDAIDAIIDAAGLAPSAKNRQPWKFYIVDDCTKINAIADIMASGDSAFKNSSIALRSASVAIFVGYDSDGDTCHREPDIQSIGASLENLLIKATELDIQSLWMCDTLDFHDEIKSFLGIEHEFVATILLGKEAKKPRKGFNEITERL